MQVVTAMMRLRCFSLLDSERLIHVEKDKGKGTVSVVTDDLAGYTRML